jgi:hypothetical protein
LPDGSTLPDLIFKPVIGQQEARAAYEAAINDSRHAFRLIAEATMLFAEAKGYDKQESINQAVFQHMNVMMPDLVDIVSKGSH